MTWEQGKCRPGMLNQTKWNRWGVNITGIRKEDSEIKGGCVSCERMGFSAAQTACAIGGDKRTNIWRGMWSKSSWIDEGPNEQELCQKAQELGFYFEAGDKPAIEEFQEWGQFLEISFWQQQSTGNREKETG